MSGVSSRIGFGFEYTEQASRTDPHRAETDDEGEGAFSGGEQQTEDDAKDRRHQDCDLVVCHLDLPLPNRDIILGLFALRNRKKPC